MSPPALAANLRADGTDPTAEPLCSLAAADIAQADLVIVFDEAVQEPGLQRARAWDIPSWNSQYADAKAALAPKFEALVDELSRRPCRS